MRFVPGGPDIPRDLIVSQEKGDTVFVCGAGVSRTVGLPIFKELVERVYQRLGESWENHPAEAEGMESRQYDRVLRCLERRLAASDARRNRNMRDRIRGAVNAELAPPEGADLTNHSALLSLSRDAEGRERLLTTNFDTLFERSWLEAHHAEISSHAGVALPQPTTANFTGVLHLHGRQSDALLRLSQTDVVLTSAEFGDAYLRAGWASRYVYDLARANTLVLVGYQADDPPMRYLLEALEADRERFPDLKRVYAFGASEAGADVQMRAQWQAKGVEPILYQVQNYDHSALYSTLREWRRYADDPTAWRREQLRLQLDTPDGTPTDTQVQAVLAWLDRGDALQLLGELSPESVWLPILMQRGVVRPSELPAVWIAKRIDDPNMIRICASLSHLDESTIWSVNRALDRERTTLSPIRERAWRLLLSVKRTYQVGDVREERWYEEKGAIERGAFDFQSRDLVVSILRPRLVIDKPYRWPEDEAANPEESLHRLLRIDFESHTHPIANDILLAWPNTIEANSTLIGALDRALMDAVERAAELGLAGNWDAASRDVRSVADHAQNQYRQGFYPIVRLLADLWSRLSILDGNQARAIAAGWIGSPHLIQKRLALYAYASGLFEPNEVVAALDTLDDHAFWATGASVEIMRLAVARWADFTNREQQAVEDRLCAGIPRELFSERAAAGDDEWQAVSDWYIYRRLTRLVASGAELTIGSKELLQEIQTRHAGWIPGEGDRDDFQSWRETHHGRGAHPELLTEVPDHNLVQQAFRIQEDRQFEEGDLWSAFCSTAPERALRGLVIEGDGARWPSDAWRSLLWAASDHVETDYQREVAEQLIRMPSDDLVAILDSASAWIERQSARITASDNGYATFFRVWDRLAAVVYGNRVENEAHDGFGDDVLTEALNRPGGHLSSTLLSVMRSIEQEVDGRLHPDYVPRLDLIISAVRRSGLLGRVKIVNELDYFDAAAPEWTRENLLPRMDWAHPDASALWEAYAYAKIGSARLFGSLKGNLLSAFQGKGLSGDVLEGLFGKLLHIAFRHRNQQDEQYHVTFAEMRQALAQAPPSVRHNVSWQLWRKMATDDDGNDDRASRWSEVVAPVFAGIWPLDVSARDEDASMKLTLMALECGDAFPEAVDAILDLLVPYRMYQISSSLRLERRHDGLIQRHPIAFVRLVNALIDPDAQPVPPDLPEVLEECIHANAGVAQDPAYIRLFGLRRHLGA